MDDVDRPRRRALAGVLIGGLLVLAAWAAAAVTVSAESATYCPSVLGSHVLPTFADRKYCEPLVAERQSVVVVVAVIGIVLVLLGVVRGRSGLLRSAPVGGHVSTVSMTVLAVVGLVSVFLATPLVFAVALTGIGGHEWNYLVQAALPVGLAAGLLLAAAIASLVGRRGHRLTLDHAMTAASLAMPFTALVLVQLYADSGPSRSGLLDPQWTSSTPRFLVTGVPMAMALLALARLQNRQQPAPPAGLAGLGVLVTATALFIAMVPEAFSGGPGVSFRQDAARLMMWLGTAFVVPWVLAMGWWAGHSGTEEVRSTGPSHA